jgi:hypothetical protein
MIKKFFVAFLFIITFLPVAYAVCPSPQPSDDSNRMCNIACNLNNSLVCKSSLYDPLCTPNGSCKYLCVEHATLVSGVCTCDPGYHANGSSCVANNIHATYDWAGGTGNFCFECDAYGYDGTPFNVFSVSSNCTRSEHKLTGYKCEKTDSSGTVIKNSKCDNIGNANGIDGNSFVAAGGSIKSANAGCDNTGNSYDCDNLSTCKGNGIKLTAVWEACKKTDTQGNDIEDGVATYNYDCSVNTCKASGPSTTNQRGYYKDTITLPYECKQCPDGIQCTGNVTHTTLCDKGYWCAKGYKNPCPAGHTTDNTGPGATGNTSGKGASNISQCKIKGSAGANCANGECTRFCDKRACFYLPVDVPYSN